MMACYFSKVPRWIKFHCSLRHCKKCVYLRIQGWEDVSYWFAHFESRNSSIMDPRSIKSGPAELIFFSSNPPPIFYMLFKRRKSIGKENSFDTWNFRFYRLLVQSSRVFSVFFFDKGQYEVWIRLDWFLCKGCRQKLWNVTELLNISLRTCHWYT